MEHEYYNKGRDVISMVQKPEPFLKSFGGPIDLAKIFEDALADEYTKRIIAAIEGGDGP